MPPKQASNISEAVKKGMKKMGDGAQQKQAKRKLGGVGGVHSSCGFANTPDRIRRLEVCVVQKDN